MTKMRGRNVRVPLRPGVGMLRTLRQKQQMMMQKKERKKGTPKRRKHQLTQKLTQKQTKLQKQLTLRQQQHQKTPKLQQQRNAGAGVGAVANHAATIHTPPVTIITISAAIITATIINITAVTIIAITINVASTAITITTTTTINVASHAATHATPAAVAVEMAGDTDAREEVSNKSPLNSLNRSLTNTSLFLTILEQMLPQKTLILLHCLAWQVKTLLSIFTKCINKGVAMGSTLGPELRLQSVVPASSNGIL